MALLGASIDPSLFRQDYSGFVNAANTNANAIAGLGQTIANTATDYFKDQNDKKKVLKQSSTQIDAAIKLYPELQGAFAPILDNLRDENISLNDRFASASATPGLIELAIGQSNKNKDFGLKTRELNIQEGNYIAKDRASQAAARSDAGKLELKSIDVGGRTGVPVLVNAAGDMFSAQNQDPIVDMDAYANGKGGTLTNNLLPDLTVDPNVPNPPPNFDYTQIPTVSGDAVPTPDRQVQAGLQAGVVNQQPQSNAADQVQAGLNAGDVNANAPVPLGRPIGGDGKAETLMTAQQVQDLAIQGFRINARPLADGSFMVSGADIGGAGETIESSPEGGFKITRGGGGGEKVEKATEARKKQQGSFVNEFVNTASETLKMIPKLPDSPIGAKLGSILGGVIPGTEIGRVVSRLGTLKANLALDKINQLREASPTGGAAGNMTVQEWPLFMQEFGSLDAAENKQDLEARLKNASVKLFNRVNGTPEQRTAALKDGTITSENNKIVEDQYNQMLSDLNISTPTAPTSSQSPLFSPETEATINKHLPK